MPNSPYTITLEVNDMPGVLVRVAQVFARRSCNISFVHVDHPENYPWSRMVITASNISRVDQIQRQLEKLIDVHKVTIS